MERDTHNTSNIKGTRLLFVGISFLLIGTGLELYLLHHFEDFFQLIPLICIASSLIVLGVMQVRVSRFIQQLFSVLMLVTALAGIFGIVLHIQTNFQFEQEMTPTHSNWDLFVESLTGAIPALAPGSLIAFSILGYSYTKLKNKTS